MFRIYLKNTWRNLSKQRITSLINISGLAIGMASAVFIFIWVQNELNFDNYHADADRIYRVKPYLTINKNKTWILENSPYLLVPEVQKQVPEVEIATRLEPIYYMPLYFNFKGEFFPEKKCAYVDENWFKVFHYDFIQGSPISFNRHLYSIILTQSAAKKYFGNQDVIGKTVRIDTIDYAVQGVVKDYPVNSSFQYDALLPVAAKMANPANLKNAHYWGNFNYQTYIRLLPSADKKQAVQKMKNILRSNREKNDLEVGIIPLAAIHFESDLENSTMPHGDRKKVNIFAILGVLLLLIACINYVNLTTARASLRIKEVSIKKIVGAERSQLLLQFIFESAFVSLLALVFALMIMKLALPFFNQLTEKEFQLSFNAVEIWVLLGGTLLISILLTSIYPALLLSSFKPMYIFRGMNLLKIKDTALRRALVITQFTISIALIIGVIVVYSQLQFIREQNNAYDRSQVLSVAIPSKIFYKMDEAKRLNVVKEIRQQLSNHTSIETVSSINQNTIIDMKGWSSGSADWDGRDPEFQPQIAYFYTDTNFKSLTNIQMAEGEWFNDKNSANGRNAILNETAVREFNIHKPVIGQRFVSQGDTGIITGVVKDFYYKNLHDKIGPVVIKNANDYNSNFLVKIRPGKIPAALSVIQNTWKAFFPGQPFSWNFLDEEFEKVYREDQKTSSLIWIFAIIAIIISCLGLFGLAAFTAERRIKEVGIRKVLGASVPGIIKLLSKDFVLLVLISFLIASPVAWWGMNKWLQDFAYHINIEWWIFMLAGVIAFTIAIITVIFQAAKAALSNPVNSLRSE